jgi:site-specific recombinase XerD
MKRFILFSGKRHPQEMGVEEATGFLTHLARERSVAASTQIQALAALLFLYREVLAAPLPWLDELERAKQPARRPTVLTQAEVQQLLSHMSGTRWLMASLLYGAGLRLRECLTLRVKISTSATGKSRCVMARAERTGHPAARGQRCAAAITHLLQSGYDIRTV